MNETEFVIGVDLGGTNVRAAVAKSDGSLTHEPAQNPSFAQEGFDRTKQAILQTIQEAIRRSGVSENAIAGIGMAVPGHVDAETGVVRWAPNFGVKKGERFEIWHDVPLAQAIQRELGKPVHMSNDANLAALAEYMYGSGKGTAKGLILLTLGTGIGGGVVLTRAQVQGNAFWDSGVLLVGANGGGGELGHAIIVMNGPQCGCGAHGCIEALAKRDAIIERAIAKMRHNPKSLLWELCESDFTKITPRLISEAAEKQDTLALEVWEEIGTFLGVAAATFINIFNPEIVAIGGQIAKAGAPLFNAIERATRDHAVPSLYEVCRVTPAEKLEEAGVLGGAALALQMSRAKRN